VIRRLPSSPNAPLDDVDTRRLRIGAPVQVVFQALAPGVIVHRWALTGSADRAGAAGRPD